MCDELSSLDKVIRKEILLQTGQFDSSTVYYLVYKSKGLSSLSFLSVFVNVTYLDISYNAVISVKNISVLKNLQTLILDGNKIDDFGLFIYF
jgi:Leucine-rich repeat (LRR) protein